MRTRAAGWLLLGAWLASSPASAAESRSFVVDGLAAPAEILVDRWGVPHLYAQGPDDLFFVQGFNAARDRLWQLDLWLRRGEGRLAEVLGSEYLEQDRAARLLLYRGDAYTEWLAYASDTKRIVTAFVRGINAFVDQVDHGTAPLPPEFARLGYRPSRWTPEAVVRIRSHGLLRNLSSEVARARFLAAFGEDPLWLRERLEPAHVAVVPDGLDLASIPADVLSLYRLGTSAVRFDRSEDESEDRAAARWLLETAPDNWSAGSNNWAIAGGRTASGRPLLANDPHRGMSVPSLRYIVHLEAPGLSVIGAGEPALPGVSIGHNGRIAFGLTIFGIDQEDLYVYQTNPDDVNQYRYRGRWEPMTIVHERVAVRGQEATDVELAFTRHGPVLHRDAANARAFALRAAWLEPGMAPYLGSIEYMRARDWDQFLAAMNRWGAPSENQVYADIAGNIGWKPGGRTPIRPNWDGLLPVPGDGRYEWSGYRTMDELPVEHNPERGWVASANQMNLPAGFPNPTGYEWAAPFRFQRISEVLAGPGRVAVDDALRLQTDSLSLPARRLLTVLASVAPRSAAERELLGWIGKWDGRLDKESAAAALFEVWWQRHLPQAVIASLVEDSALRKALGRGDSEVILDLVERPGAEWGEGAVARRDAAALDSLLQAEQETTRLLGAQREQWRWGDLHQAAIRHPLSPTLAPDERSRFDVGPLPRSGSGETVGNTSYRARDFIQDSGASFRLILDVGAWDNSVAMNSPGQSGDPASSHYRDLFAPWASDQAFPLLYSRQRIEEATVARFELLPAGR